VKKILIIGGTGYIGSRLFEYLSKDYKTDTVDLEWFGNYVNPKNIKKDYDLLPKTFFSKYSVIILLAGHSNYYMCQKNASACLSNNVVKFVKLLDNLTNQKFIYASSSSIYERTKRKVVTEETDTFSPLGYYDLTKYEIDSYAALCDKKFFGLRFGTLSGYSPNMRSDLIINRMYYSAIKTKEIAIHNPEISRPVLGIEDACRAIEEIIKKDGRPGIYNIASFSKSIRAIANTVAKSMPKTKITMIKKHIVALDNFLMSTHKFEKEFNFVFKETPESITDSLRNMHKNTKTSERK